MDLDIDSIVETDVYEPLELQDGDTLLLCSDGLHGQVEDNELASICNGKPLEQAVEKLVALANQRGGPDNITVVVGRWHAGGSEADAAASQETVLAPQGQSETVQIPQQ